jgi:hypothetical protein
LSSTEAVGDFCSGGPDGRDGLDRTCQFAFHGALEIDLLDELGRAELLVFHQFEADIAALGQTLRGQFQTRIVNAVGGHQHGPAALGVFVGDVHFFQLGDDRAAVAVAEIREQHAIVGLLPPHPDCAHDRNDRGCTQHQDDFLPVGYPGKAHDAARNHQFALTCHYFAPIVPASWVALFSIAVFKPCFPMRVSLCDRIIGSANYFNRGNRRRFSVLIELMACRWPDNVSTWKTA